MPITKDSGRQYPLVAKVPFTYADFVSGVAQEAVDLPPNAEAIGGELVITEAFNSAGGVTPADTLVVGDGDNASRYANAVNARTLARTALTLTGYKYTGKDTIDIKWTPNADTTTAPTAGAGFLLLEYVLDNRAQEVQPR